jgi:hypothetical protein
MRAYSLTCTITPQDAFTQPYYIFNTIAIENAESGTDRGDARSQSQ